MISLSLRYYGESIPHILRVFSVDTRELRAFSYSVYSGNTPDTPSIFRVLQSKINKNTPKTRVFRVLFWNMCRTGRGALRRQGTF